MRSAPAGAAINAGASTAPKLTPTRIAPSVREPVIQARIERAANAAAPIRTALRTRLIGSGASLLAWRNRGFAHHRSSKALIRSTTSVPRRSDRRVLRSPRSAAVGLVATCLPPSGDDPLRRAHTDRFEIARLFHEMHHWDASLD